MKYGPLWNSVYLAFLAKTIKSARKELAWSITFLCLNPVLFANVSKLMCSMEKKNTHVLKLCNQHCRKWDWSFWNFGFFPKECARSLNHHFDLGCDLNIESVLDCQSVGQTLGSMISLEDQETPGFQIHSSGSLLFFFQSNHSSDSARRYCKRQCLGFRVS